MKAIHKNVSTKIFALLLVYCLISNILPWQDASAKQDTARTAGYGLSNPVNSVWDCIYFGKYPQNDTNGDGTVNKDDDAEPIKWRVLSVNENDVFLLSERNLSNQLYNTLSDRLDITWETCTIRSWLNGYDGNTNLSGQDYTNDNFLDTAFTDSEQAAIAETNVAVNDNPSVFPDNGNDTTDKVYLLSAVEVYNRYGFESTWNDTVTRIAKNCDSNSNGNWWLRTIAANTTTVRACYIDTEGRLWRSDGAAELGQTDLMVRPALHLDLSALDNAQNSVWSYAGKVNSNGEEIEAELPTPEPPTESPAITEIPAPTETPAPTESLVPTQSPAPTQSPVPTDSPTATETPAPEATTEAPKPTAATTASPQSPQPSPSQSVQTLEPTKVSSITVSGAIKKLAKGKKANLHLTVKPDDAPNKNVVWSSSNPNVAVVDSSGIVTGKAAGKAVITATAADGSGVSGSYAMKVVKHAVKKIIIKANKTNVTAGKKVKIKATLKTSGKTANKTLEWSTSNQKYAVITSRGVVTTKKAGKGKTIKITAKATDGTGKKDSIKIKIK